MPRLLNENHLKEAIQKSTFIKNAKLENAEGIKYDFRISSLILKSKYGQPIDIKKLSEEERSSIFVEPGEVVFVLTEEILNLPDNIKADLIPKRKLSHDGINILGGLSIDPLYEGRLLIGLYNLSSSPFPIIPEKKLIAAQFYELRDDEMGKFIKPETKIYSFPDDLIRLMQKYSPISTQSLLDQLNKLDSKFEDMKREFKENEEWYKKFKGLLDEQSGKIDNIISALDKEVEDRRLSVDNLQKQLFENYTRTNDSIQKYSEKAYKMAGLYAGIGAVLIYILMYVIQKVALPQ